MAFAIRAVVLIFLLVPVFAWSAPVPDSQEEWRRLVTVHSAQCESESVVTYREVLAGGRRSVTERKH